MAMQTHGWLESSLVQRVANTAVEYYAHASCHCFVNYNFALTSTCKNAEFKSSRPQLHVVNGVSACMPSSMTLAGPLSSNFTLLWNRPRVAPTFVRVPRVLQLDGALHL